MEYRCGRITCSLSGLASDYMLKPNTSIWDASGSCGEESMMQDSRFKMQDAGCRIQVPRILHFASWICSLLHLRLRATAREKGVYLNGTASGSAVQSSSAI